MSETARDLLYRGITAAKAKDGDEATFYLQWVLRTDADRQQKAQAWLWLSELAGDPAEKRNCLEEALVNDPANALARRGLAILDGRLDPAEIIDPNRPRATPKEAPPQPVKTQRFICQNCGGKMAFKPDGKSLRCEYCDHQQTLLTAMNEGLTVQEHDFIVALATAKGHSHPMGMQSFTCQGCGASFLLGCNALSLTCAYCGSAHLVKLAETRELIPPEGLIPFAVSNDEARGAFHQWLKQKKLREKTQVSRLRGFYLPTWTFDLIGEIRWQCQTYRDDSIAFDVGGIPVSVSNRSRRLVQEDGSYPVLENDILVPASHKLPAELLIDEVNRFVMSDIVAYNEAYLADWPAEVYEISVSDASLVARREALEKARHYVKTRLNATLGYVKDLRLNTTNVLVESFKLILLPVWFGRYRREGTVCYVIVNGQTGEVRGQDPRNWLQKLFGNFFD
jgi:DNA-directed RNA polymerase subunit RPC12/RpoP